MAPAKQKAQKMSITTFLQDESLGSWADEMDEIPLPSVPEPRPTYSGERRAGPVSSFTDRGYSAREEPPLPTQPPFTAHIGNLSFNATQSDIADLFVDCNVTSVRVVEDKLTHTPKGFGYVEFATVGDLSKALSFQGASLQGRSIRVSVAEPPKERQEPTRDFSDWSRKGPLPDLPRHVSGPGSDAGSERGAHRRSYEPADGKIRDFNNWERKGPLSPSIPPSREGGRTRSKDSIGFRRTSPWGEGSDNGSRPPRRLAEPTAPELDNQWRARMQPDLPPPSPADNRQPPSSPAPATRPRLNLAKRTVPAEPASTPPPSATTSKFNPFGAAKPIDSAARERQVEERRQHSAREKKEADDKARVERAERARIAKEEQRAAAAAAGANGDEFQTGAKNFEILQRHDEPQSPGSQAEGSEAPADSQASEQQDQLAGSTDASHDAAQDAHQQQQDGKVSSNENGNGGNWRQGHVPAARRGNARFNRRGTPRMPAPEPAASAPTDTPAEDDGWNTVGPKQRSNRRSSRIH